MKEKNIVTVLLFLCGVLNYSAEYDKIKKYSGKNIVIIKLTGGKII